MTSDDTQTYPQHGQTILKTKVKFDFCWTICQHNISCLIITYRILWFHIISYDIIWYRMIWYHMIWSHIVWYHMIRYDITLVNCTWYHRIPFHIISYDMISYDMMCQPRSTPRHQQVKRIWRCFFSFFDFENDIQKSIKCKQDAQL